jgi:hypothetical protein
MSLEGGGGLIDNNTINASSNQETAHIFGVYGDEGPNNWANALTPGSSAAIYYENNTVTGTEVDLTCFFQNWAGGRVVARFNTVNLAMLENHGTSGRPGARW